MSKPSTTLYDRDDYYLGNKQGSRLFPIFDWLLYLLEWERIFAVLRTLKGTRGSVLDVGAGDGKFLFWLARKGFQVSGTTASQRSAEAAKDFFGIELHVTEGLDEVVPKAPFNLITYWHVFEHLAKPDEHIKQWRSLLADNGILIIEVPNIESLGARLSWNAWLGSDPLHHINHVPPKQIVDLIKKSGLTVESVSHASLKFTHVFLWSAWLGYFFPRTYDFDKIMHLLKKPLESIKHAPVASINAVASLVYLAPLVLVSSILGLVLRRGEVIRVYARK
jgi:SAM-dependent methyltransferase